MSDRADCLRQTPFTGGPAGRHASGGDFSGAKKDIKYQRLHALQAGTPMIASEEGASLRFRPGPCARVLS